MPTVQSPLIGDFVSQGEKQLPPGDKKYGALMQTTPIEVLTDAFNVRS